MSKLPAKYQWLEKEPAPKMLLEALKTYGILEAPGDANNPVIIGWAKEVGVDRVYNADAIPWCGLWMALIAKRAGKDLFMEPKKLLWAMNWGKWGNDGGQPELGDVLVFMRESGGHVGMYIGEDKKNYYVLGGNQSNSVCIKPIEKTRLRYCRQFFKEGKPSNVRSIVLASSGEPVSTNEA